MPNMGARVQDLGFGVRLIVAGTVYIYMYIGFMKGLGPSKCQACRST